MNKIISDIKNGVKGMKWYEWIMATIMVAIASIAVYKGFTNPNSYNPAYFSNVMTVYAVIDKDLEKKFNKRGEQILDENEDCEVFIDWLSNKRFFGNAMQMAGYTLLKQKFD